MGCNRLANMLVDDDSDDDLLLLTMAVAEEEEEMKNESRACHRGQVIRLFNVIELKVTKGFILTTLQKHKHLVFIYLGGGFE